jgi:hypothetical protein
VKRNRPVTLTDKEINAISDVATVFIIRAFQRNTDCCPLVSAVKKLQASQRRCEIEIPEERLKVLE